MTSLKTAQKAYYSLNRLHYGWDCAPEGEVDNPYSSDYENSWHLEKLRSIIAGLTGWSYEDVMDYV